MGFCLTSFKTDIGQPFIPTYTRAYAICSGVGAATDASPAKSATTPNRTLPSRNMAGIYNCCYAAMWAIAHFLATGSAVYRAPTSIYETSVGTVYIRYRRGAAPRALHRDVASPAHVL